MKIHAIALLLLLLSVRSHAQEARPSPLAMATAKYQDTYVKITYGQVQKRGREIFGSLVPYGEVWRTGANEATEITLTKDILINGILLKTGTYSIFTIPERIKWTIIINSAVGLWGSYNYDPKLDVTRFDIPVQELENENHPSFTIAFDQNNDKADLVFMWDRIKVDVPIRFIGDH
jgi:Protein of unknown function (DUF2911)